MRNESEKAILTKFISLIVFSVHPKFYEKRNKMNRREPHMSAQVKIEKFNKRPGRLFESLR